MDTVKHMVNIFSILYISLFSFSCSFSDKKEQNIQVNEVSVEHIEPVDSLKENESFDMKTIRLHYKENDVTSGKSNKPEVINNCILSVYDNFGFYDIIDRKSKLKPAVVAKVLVSFKSMPWHYVDDDQTIIAVIVFDKLFKCDWFSFDIGDETEKMSKSFNKEMIIEDISYFRKENIVIAVKSNKGEITKYMFWQCDSTNTDVKRKHQIVKKYLK